MNIGNPKSSIILVVEDVAETRDGIEKLLHADGYHVVVARDEKDAIAKARLHHPDLILVSLAGVPDQVVARASRIRDVAGVGNQVHIVVFCDEDLAAGEEVDLGHNVYVTRPDNFNQLRSLLVKLVDQTLVTT